MSLDLIVIRKFIFVFLILIVFFYNRRFLEELCMILYDKLRPIIIHAVHIETLAELCSILKSEILADNVRSTKADQLSAFDGKIVIF